jgi:hypothetical protein
MGTVGSVCLQRLAPSPADPYLVLAVSATPAAAAEECTQTSSPIETDRPDVTNSSVVVPIGSFQNDYGINISRNGGGPVFDDTNSRLRLGIAPCLEMLLDLPTYVTAVRGPGPSGFTNVAPGIKSLRVPNGSSARSPGSSIS